MDIEYGNERNPESVLLKTNGQEYSNCRVNVMDHTEVKAPDRNNVSDSDILIDKKCDTNSEHAICSQPLVKNNNIGSHLPEVSHSHAHIEEFLTVPTISRAQSIQETLCHGPVTCLAIFTTFCCNLVLGIPAFVLAVLAQSVQEHGISHMYSRISLMLSLIGMVTGIIFYVTIIIYVVSH